MNKMNWWVRLACGCLVLLLLFLPAATGMAASVSLTIPVENAVKGGGVTNYVIRLTALSRLCPMPRDVSGGDTEEKTIRGSGSTSFTIDFTQPGEYDYRIEQLNGGVKGCTYDPTVYNVRVFVRNDGQGGFTTNVVYDNGGTAKPTIVRFDSAYYTKKDDENEDPPQTDDENNIFPWILLGAGALLTALICLILIILLRRRQRREEDE